MADLAEDAVLARSFQARPAGVLGAVGERTGRVAGTGLEPFNDLAGREELADLLGPSGVPLRAPRG
jgi:hypothetical protein